MLAIFTFTCACDCRAIVSVARRSQRHTAAELAADVAGRLGDQPAAAESDGTYRCPGCGARNELSAEPTGRLLEPLVARMSALALYEPSAN